ncbi:MAG TPA: galactose-1-phosphate uridylyltransferase [Bacteroidetes bacterium]|nr:galactose-1-phosphate uridylyltransferase [Bacteroidota bacterium]
MPELRKDPIVGRWVIISTERGNRPGNWREKHEPVDDGFCPFCPGNEDKTPAEVFAIRKHDLGPNMPDWDIRVVPNKFPALQIEGEDYRRGEGLYDLMNGVGAHEVVIETPDHGLEFSDYPEEQIVQILLAYRERMLDLKKDKRFKYILVFKNHGRAAGASLEHPHSQLIATPILPKRVVEEIEGSRLHFARKERCIFCDILHQESSSGKRTIAQNDHFVAIAPFAPRFPYECWILPSTHFSHFECMESTHYDELAAIMKTVLRKINKALTRPPYNFILHSMPVQDDIAPEYHWHLEIIPKLTRIAGFEWGSGFYINPVSPEDAARQLREADG